MYLLLDCLSSACPTDKSKLVYIFWLNFLEGWISLQCSWRCWLGDRPSKDESLGTADARFFTGQMLFHCKFRNVRSFKFYTIYSHFSLFFLAFLACNVRCSTFIQYGSDSATDLRSVRSRARANWIGPEPDSVLRSVSSYPMNSVKQTQHKQLCMQ